MVEFDENCKACRAIVAEATPLRVWENEMWVLKHTGAPYAELGWMTLHSRRHATAFTDLTDDELADFGRTIRRIQDALVKATGALRVYFVSMTENTPHVHAHLVPRYSDGPKGWDVWMLKRQPGSRDVSDEAVSQVIRDVAHILQTA